MLALSPKEAKLLGDDGGKRAVLRGEHEVSRKAIAQGRPGCSACTCMLVCAFLCAIAHETAGAACTRSSLRPPLLGGATDDAKLGREMSREGETISASLRAQRRNPPLRLPCDGLLRCARNDVERPQRTGCPVCTGTTASCATHRLPNTIFSCNAFIEQRRDQSVITICSFGTQIAALDSTKLFLLVRRGLQWR